MTDASPEPRDLVVIKKYANRRLYNTESSSYITLDHLAQLVRDGRDFKVVDARTGEDLTRSVLAQIIMESESRGANLLPAGFLRQIIGMYGDSMQNLVPQYLEASMTAFRRNQSQFQQAMKGAFEGTPFADLAKRNLAMFEAAAKAFKPAEPPRPQDDEVAALKAQLAELQAKVDKLGG